MKIVIIIVLILVSCKKNVENLEAADKTYEIVGVVSEDEEIKVISLLKNNHSLDSIIKIIKHDDNHIEALVKINEEDRVSYMISNKSNEWAIVMNSTYKVIKGFVVLVDLDRPDLEKIINVLKDIKPSFSKWEISKENKGVIEVNNYDDSSTQEGIGITYKMIKKNGSWQIVEEINWET